MQGRKNRQEKLFVSFQLSDHVPEDNIYRKINNLIDFSFLYKATAGYYGSEGQKSIDPVVFIKLMLVGYLENLNSDRRIINTLGLRLDIRYFIGYELDEELPWHSTLSRTRHLYGQLVFTELFQRILKQCIEKGMVSGRRQAIDSVFIKANASVDSMLEKEILDDVVNYSQELEVNEDNPTNSNEDRSDEDKNTKKTNDTHYSPVDPDARLSTKPGKPYTLNYLGQVSVDTATHMITYVQAFTADKRDSQCLPVILSGLSNILREHNIKVEEIIADTNYSSGTALKALEVRNITGYIPNTGKFQYERRGFIYDADKDLYKCKWGKELTYRGTYGNDKRYKTKPKDCLNCPFKVTCIGNKTQAVINETIDKPYYSRMHERMQTPKAHLLMKKRQATVEPVIGTLVEYLGVKKVMSRGLAQANKSLTMAAIAYNLKKLLKHQVKRFQSNINELRKEFHSNLTTYLTLQ